MEPYVSDKYINKYKYISHRNQDLNNVIWVH